MYMTGELFLLWGFLAYRQPRPMDGGGGDGGSGQVRPPADRQQGDSRECRVLCIRYILCMHTHARTLHLDALHTHTSHLHCAGSCGLLLLLPAVQGQPTDVPGWARR